MAGWFDGWMAGPAGCSGDLRMLEKLIFQRSTIKQFNHQAI
jgi:hypothetical protein